ncbi:ras GEF [Coprinopsis marcescibilis]|uniref:Ras GEF n=1 Tax=Coprinopsis marcescibilis TaxID=230819 RepID=A0A5C3KKX6_COPMA|nr:ras GEF [Coprinopsis marcescibilis]
MVSVSQAELFANNAAETAISSSLASTRFAPTNELNRPHDQEDIDSQYTMFCRALYNYDAQDGSALSFKQGEIIEVLSQQPSGWWDGLLGEERGWFPSNYVTIITDDEAEQAFSGSELSSTDYSNTTLNQGSSTVDMSHALMSGSQSENEEWVLNETSYSNGTPAPPAPSSSSQAQPADFWVPEITPDNQIWYKNERTGQRAREIPVESEDEASDGDLAGLTSQASSRSGTSVHLPFALNGATESSKASLHTQSTTEPPPSSRTPEPWVKTMDSDGTYFYLNTQTGKTQWTRPHPQQNGSAPATNPTDSFLEPSLSANGSRLSVYSDSSDVQPLDYVNPRREIKRDDLQIQGADGVDPGIMEATSAENIAQQLREALAPPPSDLVTGLSAVAASSIQAVVENIQTGSVTRPTEEYARLDELVSHVVVAVRNLLYVAAIPTGHIPSSVLPRGYRDIRASQAQSSPLKPVQRRVTATLSRLVLSARAMQYDSGSQIADTLNRIETDAEELERAVQSFVAEVQRTQQTGLRQQHQKRLEGVFLTANIGLGLVGAGAAASWKGFGWVPLESDVVPPKKALGAEVIHEITTHLSGLQDTIAGMGQALRITNDSSIEQVRQKVQQTVAQISAFLSLVADVNIARHIDIDGIHQGEVTTNASYYQSVEKARTLVRTLETVLQGLYDDSAALLLTAQNLPDGDSVQPPGERESSFDLLDKLSTSMSSNLSQCRQSLEKILSVGQDQADMAGGDYTGSIEWRMSRLSVMTQQPSEVQTRVILEAPYESENEGVVGLDYAFSPSRKLSSANDSSYDRTLANGYESSIPTDSTSNLDRTLVAPDRNSVYLSDDDDLPKTVTRSAKSKDLQTWLGHEYADKVAAESIPWYLRPSYSPSDIIIENDGSVRGGTVSALVERLTAHEQLTDRIYTEAFLMSFKSFTTVDELIDLLIERFRIQPPEGLSPTEREDWGKLKQHIIQIRVIKTLKSIIQGEDIIEREDMHVLDKIKAFIQSDEVSGFPAAKQLLNLIERARGGDNTKAMINTTLSPPPPPIMPKSTKKLRLMDIEPLELARQLTIMESQLYQRIKPMECLQRAREQKTENIDNITLVIQTSNKIADWVADLVLSKEDSRKRAQIVKHLISVADRCRALNNFSSMIAITSGLNTPPIRRLKRTWEQVSQRYLSQFQACEMTIDSNKNFTKYRQLMASVTPPCVPFIGVFLSTLQFIQDGNPDILPGGLVNFRKRQKASEVISDIKGWQTQSFNLQPVPLVSNYIEESLNQFSNTRASSDHFWQLSLEREPREREDEKMARLLQESGFL